MIRLRRYLGFTEVYQLLPFFLLPVNGSFKNFSAPCNCMASFLSLQYCLGHILMLSSGFAAYVSLHENLRVLCCILLIFDFLGLRLR